MPHPVIVTIRDSRDYIKVLRDNRDYIKVLRDNRDYIRVLRDNRDYIRVLLYSYYTTITGWGGPPNLYPWRLEPMAQSHLSKKKNKPFVVYGL